MGQNWLKLEEKSSIKPMKDKSLRKARRKVFHPADERQTSMKNQMKSPSSSR